MLFEGREDEENEVKIEGGWEEEDRKEKEIFFPTDWTVLGGKSRDAQRCAVEIVWNFSRLINGCPFNPASAAKRITSLNSPAVIGSFFIISDAQNREDNVRLDRHGG